MVVEANHKLRASQQTVNYNKTLILLKQICLGFEVELPQLATESITKTFFPSNQLPIFMIFA